MQILSLEAQTTVCEECETGSIRLSDFVDTSEARQGRVEVCINGAWGSVCNNFFGEEEAKTVCSSLMGFSNESENTL